MERESALMRIDIDESEYWIGNVKFAEPASYRAVLTPFAKVLDGQGNSYSVGGLVGLLRAIKSAKEKKPETVLCLRESGNAYRIVRWV